LERERRVRAQRPGAVLARLRPGRHPRGPGGAGAVLHLRPGHPGALGPPRHPPLPGGHLHRARPALPGRDLLSVPRRLRHLPARLPRRRAGPAPGRGQPGPGLRDQGRPAPVAQRLHRGPGAARPVPGAGPVNKILTLPRHPGDVLRLVAGLAILLGCIATVRPNDAGVLETDVFRLANDLPDALFPAFWVVMQGGNVLAIGVAAVVVAATRRFWLAANLAITGVGVWLAARWVQD